MEGPACHGTVFKSLEEKRDLEFDDKAHSSTHCMEETCQAGSGESCFRATAVGTGDAKGQREAPH